MSIYKINDWLAGTNYGINAIVRYLEGSNTYYYSLRNNNLANPPSPSSAAWGGVSSSDGITRPHFIWKPSYQVVVNHEPKTTQISFGDGYTQRLTQNIHNDLINLELMFDLRIESESEAINHFLYARGAKEAFLFTPTTPHNTQKLFICRKWNDSFVFWNNHTIKCNFEEVPA